MEGDRGGCDCEGCLSLSLSCANGADMAGVKKIGQYSLGETLGTGSFGKVKRK